ncbi:hypothetical protein GCM10007235_20390 [Pseudoxanthomonas indica]|nr:hypothetical protein GCM10007235_20390 [Pseudoxanthomonas indica]
MGDAITKLKTKEALLQNLRDAKKPSAAEVREQRVSFVFGSLDSKSPITREMVRKALESA